MHIWKMIYQSLVNGQEVVVATIISASGSTPRKSGSKMLVYSDGRALGTIGGGAVEGDVVGTALDVFLYKNNIIKAYNLNNTSSMAEMDLICGGQVEVLIEYVAIDDSSLDMYRMLSDAAEAHLPTICVGKLLGDSNNQLVRAVKISDGQWLGPLHVSSKLHKEFVKNRGKKAKTLMVSIDEEKYVIESIHPVKTIFLIGAGHVSKDIALLVNKASFSTIVIDDRIEFATKERFPAAEKILLIPQYINIFKDVSIDAESYIIIVTWSHQFDKEVLAQALKTHAGYIGMIGSTKKRQRIYSSLAAEGFDAADLKRVYCPVGLAIDAETPFEIAVSIVGQLIQHRARSERND